MLLLEREDLVRKLDSYLAGVAGGVGAFVCLTGEAGIGKTSVAQVVAERAGAKARILWGACEDLSTPAPLAPLLDFAREGSWRLPPADDFASRIAFFEAAFERLTSEPTLAILEDLHWADDATLDFVRFSARRLRKAPLLLLVTARDDSSESQARLRRVLADVPPDKYERIELRSLTEDTVRKIAIDHGQAGPAVYALTSGNPFLTMEVLKQGNDCPTTVSDALLWRADKLSPPARAALDAASVFPRRVERNVLEKMCAENADGILVCVAGGLLQVERDFYWFRHEIARRAIEGALSQPLRFRLNQRALEILKSSKTANTARLVHHAIEAHDVLGISVLAPLAATEAANAGAHREAAKHLRTSFEHVDTWGPNRRADLLEQLGYELQLTGEVNAAIETFQSALELRQRCGDQLRAGDDLRWISRLHYNAGERGKGDEAGRRAVDVLGPLGQTYELAMAYANLALISALRDDSKGAIELANKTKALAEELGHKELLADAHGTLGIANQWLDLPTSRKHFEAALTLALECNRPELVARIYLGAGNIELNARAGKNARRWLEAGVRYCDERDLLTWAVYMKGLLADLLIREGVWSEGESLAREALDASTTPVQRFPSSVALARLQIRRGDEADALFGNLTFDTEPQRVMVYAPIVGERAWLLKLEIDASIEVLRKAGAVADAIGNIWAAGEIEYWLSKLEGKSPNPFGKVAEPFALLFGGDWAAAADAWKDLEAPYERAMALLQGDEGACDEALSILDGLGASATASRARHELRARGLRGLRRGPRESTRSNAAGLTRREMDVLRLLDAGMSNAEIAARLNTAPKTADHHVSAILAKLDSSSRLEAVTKARKLRLFDSDNQSSS